MVSAILNRACFALLWFVAPLNANVASTTRYWDCSGGACGCGYLSSPSNREAHCHSNALFVAPSGNSYGATFYGSAAVSQALGGGDWLADGCGKCWKLTGTSNIGSNTATTTLVLKATNYCPPSNSACNGRAHFDIAAPGFDFAGASLSNTCSVVEPNEIQGFTSCGNWMIRSSDPTENCDCSLFVSDVLRAGCENFLSLRWNNVDVSYEEVNCPEELSRLPCWEENGRQWPNQIGGFCKDPGVVPEGSTLSPSQEPSADPMEDSNSDPDSPDGYCSWSMCMSGAEGGDWCNESEERCISCGSGSQWCKADASDSNSESRDPSAAPSFGPSETPSTIPSVMPSFGPSSGPSAGPSFGPSAGPSTGPSTSPSTSPSATPSATPSAMPQVQTSENPSLDEDPARTDSPVIDPESNDSSSGGDEEKNIFFKIFFCFL